MGMMINRRRVCGGSKLPYVQDGLIFWLDGIWNNKVGSHISGLSTWNDLTGNHQTSGSVEFVDNYANFKGDSYISFNSPQIIDAINNNSCTIELVMRPVAQGTNSNNTYIFLGDSVRGFWIWDNITYAIASYSYRRSYYTEINKYSWGHHGHDLSICSKGKTLYLNLSKYTTANYNVDNVTNKSCYVGGGLGHAKFRAYAVRIYNRILTDDELLQNIETDKKRFNINFN